MLTDNIIKSAVAEIVDSISAVYGVPVAIADAEGELLHVPDNWTLQDERLAPGFVKFLIKMHRGGIHPVIKTSAAETLALIPLKFDNPETIYAIADLADMSLAGSKETEILIETLKKSLTDLSIYATWEMHKKFKDLDQEYKHLRHLFRCGRTTHQELLKSLLDTVVNSSLAEVAVIAVAARGWEEIDPLVIAGDQGCLCECFKQCGLSWWSMHANDSLVVKPQNDPRCHGDLPKTGIKLVSIWPLFMHDKTFGVLYLANRTGKTLLPWQREYLDSVAIRVSMILSYTYMEKEVTDLARKLNALSEISRVLNSSLELNRVLDLVADMSVNIFRVRKCCVYLADEVSADIKLMAARGIKSHELSVFEGRFRKKGRRFNASSHKFIDFPIRVKDKDGGFLSLGGFHDDGPTPEDRELIVCFTHIVGAAIENSRMFKDTERTLLETITVLSLAIEARDKAMFGHSERVRELAVALAEALGLSQKEIAEIESAGLLHDIGKLGISETLLNKSGQLTAREFEIFKKHPVIGANILRVVTSFDGIRDAIRHHHERYDGKGYPRGLKGNEIPLGSRILAIADSFDALVSRRSYRMTQDPFAALEIIKENAGTQFDPRLVSVFEKLICQRYSLKINIDHDDGDASLQVPQLGARELGLTDREAEILSNIAAGLNNREIADNLFLSEKTVKTHVTHILKKLNLSDRTKAAIYAIQKGLVNR